MRYIACREKKMFIPVLL